MATTQKINDHRMLQMKAEGKTLEQIGKEFGVGRSAVCQRLKKLQSSAAKYMVEPRGLRPPNPRYRDASLPQSYKAGRQRSNDGIMRRHLDTAAQLTMINNYANELLSSLMSWLRGDKEALRSPDNGKGSDPRELALKTMNEIRSQLNLQIEIFKILASTQAIQEFKDTVIDIINMVDPDVRNRILEELHRRRAISGSTLRNWIDPRS